MRGRLRVSGKIVIVALRHKPARG